MNSKELRKIEQMESEMKEELERKERAVVELEKDIEARRFCLNQLRMLKEK